MRTEPYMYAVCECGLECEIVLEMWSVCCWIVWRYLQTFVNRSINDRVYMRSWLMDISRSLTTYIHQQNLQRCVCACSLALKLCSDEERVIYDLNLTMVCVIWTRCSKTRRKIESKRDSSTGHLDVIYDGIDANTVQS